MNKQHPYPNHIIDAVANVLSQEFHSAYEIGSFDDLTVYDQDTYKDKASYVLRTLWDASRIDSIEQLEQVPPFSILVDDSGLEYGAYEIRNPNIFPLHVIFWSDHDDR